ncbi:hypothetical protein NVP1187O_129 [Vibrio phage 1.187.O._10N.286.49.F1]|nr:hypothetical protein NVP1187O_129 [Vibrio phage 1.187.O._10N.286.49.F1]
MSSNKKPQPIFKPASPKQALMLQRASDTQVVIIGGAK